MSDDKALPRSDRDKRGKNMKHLVLTEDDKNLFMYLHDFIYLDMDFIVEYVFDRYKTRQSASTRLLKLEDSGYLKKFRAMTPDSPEGYSANVYTLTATGVAVVEELQGYSRWKVRWTRDLPMWYLHSLQLARAVISYELQAPKYGLEVKDFVHETRGYFQFTKQKEDVIRPDGFIVLGPKDSEENFGFFLEMERTVSRRHVLQSKIEQYTTFLKHSDARMRYQYDKGLEAYVKNWQVIFIAEDESKLKRTLRLMAMLKPEEGKQPSQMRPDVHIPVRLTNLDDIKENGFGEIYHHIDEEDFKLKRMF